jgi:hypothetical protein
MKRRETLRDSVFIAGRIAFVFIAGRIAFVFIAGRIAFVCHSRRESASLVLRRYN